LEHLNTQIELVTGRIQKVYALDGSQVTQIEELERGKAYVLVSNDDPYIRTRYNVMAVNYTKSQGLNGSTLKNEYMSSIRPITQRRSSKYSLHNYITHNHDKFDNSDNESIRHSVKKPAKRPQTYERHSGIDTDAEDNRGTN
jgi:Doublecortin